ncbi:MAG TPA: hypothetical protein VIY52_29040 [Streptosporangiaceae bacterium]
MLLDLKDGWLAARIEDLDYGDIDGICRAARAYPVEGIKKDELDTRPGLLREQRPPHALSLVPPVRPVHRLRVVEAGCKTVIGQRLELSGMHWTAAGADAISTLRCQQASRPQDRIWHPPHNQTPAA